MCHFCLYYFILPIIGNKVKKKFTLTDTFTFLAITQNKGLVYDDLDSDVIHMFLYILESSFITAFTGNSQRITSRLKKT